MYGNKKKRVGDDINGHNSHIHGMIHLEFFLPTSFHFPQVSQCSQSELPVYYIN